MTDELYSVRMRASEADTYVSGAETITDREGVESTARAMIERALDHPRGDPDDVVVTVDRLAESPMCVSALPVVTVEADSVESGRHVAGRLLADAGVSPSVVDRALAVLGHSTAERGAALLDAETGKRRDPDPERGVRVSRLGTSDRGDEELDRALDAHGLASTRIRDALVLATKVTRAPGVVAELCWSDNPDYTAGYVATRDGYYRFPALKAAGDSQGGRAFFLAPDADVDRTVTFLKERPVVVDTVQSFDQVTPSDLLSG
ncbi:6-carboxyhexanoate--CoA ligase [Halobacterium salinarum]|uniref:6-carboxyhexanoate--CoA ligase n=1 Tax=Halobacterium salinarum TaxID=2242 RepID=UPI002556ECC3|nr:6-carboxyhexanoate--CoA ligase [Halobacterium salinarum]MDL0133810.1 6-carboxyhexanoate--CoA ligase [Halobacterium salinarum]